MTAAPPNLKQVTKRSRCPMCGRDSYCLVAKDDSEIVCTKVESPVWIEGLNGWKHLTGTPQGPRVTVFSKWVRPGPNPEMRRLNDIFQSALTDDMSEACAARLGLEDWPLNAVGIGWSKRHDANTFPMHNDAGEVVGIRLRNNDGEKWAIDGSRNGLFGQNFDDPDQQVFVAEGPTDTAALIQLGLFAWGRSSCKGEKEMLVALAKRFVRDWVIVGDVDRPDDDCRQCGERRNCHACRPGEYGAWQLADMLLPLAKSVRVIFPTKGKDVRKWVTEYGATAKTIQSVINITNPMRARRTA